MPVENAETPDAAHGVTVMDRVADAVRHATHLSHEARLAKSIASDARDEAAHTARRLVRRARRGAETLIDVKNDAAVYIRRRPLVSVGVAAGTGLFIGLAAGWIGSRAARRRVDARPVDEWKDETGE